ncbi:diadenylate cyclase CdaA [Calditrichota bacterium]
MDLFNLGFLQVQLIDILDVVAVTIVFYQLYKILRGTRATQMFAGLLVLMGAGALSQLLGMSGMMWIIQSIGAVWVIAFVILFQPELRRMLMGLGQLRIIRSIFRTGGEKLASEISFAAAELSRRRFGGLIVIQRTTGIRGVIENGIRIQADVSWQLLVSVFFPRTPLHDGAVIISGDTIEAAHCILPLNEQYKSDKPLGTRHRAALGITQEVDAIAVVVSEETGAISVTENGDFVGRDMTEEDLKSTLLQLLYPKLDTGGDKGKDLKEPLANPQPSTGSGVID